jgi:hypothetical protein
MLASRRGSSNGLSSRRGGSSGRRPGATSRRGSSRGLSSCRGGSRRLPMLSIRRGSSRGLSSRQGGSSGLLSRLASRRGGSSGLPGLASRRGGSRGLSSRRGGSSGLLPGLASRRGGSSKLPSEALRSSGAMLGRSCCTGCEAGDSAAAAARGMRDCGVAGSCCLPVRSTAVAVAVCRPVPDAVLQPAVCCRCWGAGLRGMPDPGAAGRAALASEAAARGDSCARRPCPGPLGAPQESEADAVLSAMHGEPCCCCCCCACCRALYSGNRRGGTVLPVAAGWASKGLLSCVRGDPRIWESRMSLSEGLHAADAPASLLATALPPLNAGERATSPAVPLGAGLLATSQGGCAQRSEGAARCTQPSPGVAAAASASACRTASQAARRTSAASRSMAGSAEGHPGDPVTARGGLWRCERAGRWPPPRRGSSPHLARRGRSHSGRAWRLQLAPAAAAAAAAALRGR